METVGYFTSYEIVKPKHEWDHVDETPSVSWYEAGQPGCGGYQSFPKHLYENNFQQVQDQSDPNPSLSGPNTNMKHRAWLLCPKTLEFNFLSTGLMRGP